MNDYGSDWRRFSVWIRIDEDGKWFNEDCDGDRYIYGEWGYDDGYKVEIYDGNGDMSENEKNDDDEKKYEDWF